MCRVKESAAYVSWKTVIPRSTGSFWKKLEKPRTKIILFSHNIKIEIILSRRYFLCYNTKWNSLFQSPSNIRILLYSHHARCFMYIISRLGFRLWYSFNCLNYSNIFSKSKWNKWKTKTEYKVRLFGWSSLIRN